MKKGEMVERIAKLEKDLQSTHNRATEAEIKADVMAREFGFVFYSHDTHRRPHTDWRLADTEKRKSRSEHLLEKILHELTILNEPKIKGK